VTSVGFEMTKGGMNVITPITASVRMQEYALKRDQNTRLITHEEWMRADLEMLGRCDQLCVLMLPGWEKSRGVREEIEFAQERQIPIIYLRPDLYLEKNQLGRK
jgi:hypothetical protein